MRPQIIHTIRPMVIVIIFIIFLYGCCMIPCIPLPSPFDPASDSIYSKIYQDKKYEVCEECSKDVQRALILDLGEGSLQNISTQRIASWFKYMIYNGDTNIKKNSKGSVFEYCVVKKGSYLQLVLIKLDKTKTHVINEFKGLKRHDLKNCRVEKI